MRFNTAELRDADILAGRNLDPTATQAWLIRAILGSYTNHNALFITYEGQRMIGDTCPPCASRVPLEQYERLVTDGLYEVRVWRVVGMSEAERMRVAYEWLKTCDGVPYPSKGVMRLWVMRFVNHLPYEINGQWCTKNTLRPFYSVIGMRSPQTRPDGQFKWNPTPRTMENRLVAGVLEDVTRQVVTE